MKKRIFAIAVVMICISILASTTLAYFTDIGTARNVITSGGIEINIVEQQLIGDSLVPYEDPLIPLMPGAEISKIVSVQNVQQTAWIRVNYTVTVFDANKQPMDIPADELAKIIIIKPNSEHWTQKDGWWYHNDPVKTGNSTAPIFEEVVFSGPDMGNEYQNCEVQIHVDAFAMQHANNGSTVLEAAWPEN